MSEFKEVAGETISRGEIYWYRNESGAEGSEQGNNRPCIVVSNDKANTYGPTVTIVPLTTAEKKPLPTHVQIDSALEPSIAVCEQVKTITKSRLSQYIGECSTEEMKGIDKALRIQLALEEKEPMQKIAPPPTKEEKSAVQVVDIQTAFTTEKTRADIFERLYRELLTEKIAK